MRIGLLGAGTVGSALLALLAEHGPDLTDRLGEPFELVAAVVRDPARRRAVPLPAGAQFTDDAARIVDDPTVEIVVEAMGGTDPARAYALRVLARGGALVTANKALIAAHGPQLFEAASHSGGDVLFEAAVGAAVPVVGALQGALSAARLTTIAGVLNGSTNFVLARLAAGRTLAAAMDEARVLGYLEADPTDDVDGHDAARKIAILASLADNRHLRPERVATRGLSGLEPDDLTLARALGAELKLLAVAERDGAGAGYTAWVAPALVPATNPLAAVRGAANAVLIASRPGGETLLAGQGAGGGPTASAVAGDLLTAARRRRSGARGPAFAWRDEAPGAAVPKPPPQPQVLRVVLAPGASAPAVEAAARAVAGAGGVVARGRGWFALATAPIADAALPDLRSRLARTPGVAAVGPAIVHWRPPAAEGENWWQPPLGEVLVAATREEGEGG